jgi:hypothetical protein
VSLVASRLSLIHRCTIERDDNAGSTSADGWGDPPDWQAHLTDLACRWWTSGGRETVTDKDTTVAVDSQMLIVPLDTDVTEQDRVNDITYRGVAITGGPIGIRAVNPKKDHLELILMRIA